MQRSGGGGGGSGGVAGAGDGNKGGSGSGGGDGGGGACWVWTPETHIWAMNGSNVHMYPVTGQPQTSIGNVRAGTMLVDYVPVRHV